MTKIGQQNLRGLTFLKNSTYSEDDSREPLVEIAIKLSKNYAPLLVRWPGYGTDAFQTRRNRGCLFLFQSVKSGDGEKQFSQKYDWKVYFVLFWSEYLFDHFNLKQCLYLVNYI